MFSFIFKAEGVKISFMVSRSAEFNLAARFLKYAIVHINNSSTIKDKKNLSTKMNYTGLITLLAKFQPPLLVNSYSILKYETLVPIILSTPTAMALKH